MLLPEDRSAVLIEYVEEVLFEIDLGFYFTRFTRLPDFHSFEEEMDIFKSS